MRLLLVVAPALVLAAACSSTPGGSSAPPCVADATEPNEAPLKPPSLGQIHDDDVAGQPSDATPKRLDKVLSLHDGSDIDWFQVDVLDTGINGNPKTSVFVSEGFEANVFWTCTNGTTDSVQCGLGTQITEDGSLHAKGCHTAAVNGGPAQFTMQIECGGTSDDSGRLLVHVTKTTPAAACESYRLTVAAD
jgi:hypothetical protein